jgi:tryptophan halogenase
MFLNETINRITIVGGGTAGYMTVLFLCKTFPEKQITWIYPEDNNPIGVGEAIVPGVSMFLAKLGVSSTDIINNANGTFKLGSAFKEFSIGQSFTFPFDTRTSFMKDLMDDNDILSDWLDRGWAVANPTHFRCTDLLTYLDTIMPSLKNLTILRKITTLEEIEGTYDFVIDSTGFGRRLLGEDKEFVSITDKIPNNAAYVYRHPYVNKAEQMVPHTVFEGMDYGWVWNIPLKDEMAYGYVHDDKYDVKEDFVKLISSKVGVDIDPNEVRKVSMRTGRNTTHITKDSMYVGLSSSFIEPLESTGLLITVRSLELLKAYLQGTVSIDEANFQINKEFDALVDFVVIHYKYSNRDNDYWNHYKNIPTDAFENGMAFQYSKLVDYLLPRFKGETPTELMDVPKELNDAQRESYPAWFDAEFN